MIDPEPRGTRPARPSRRLTLPVAVLAALVACSEPPPPDVVARVADRWVPMERFDEYLERAAGEDGADLPSEVLSKILDRFLEEELLIRLAEERGVASAENPRRRVVERLLLSEPDPVPTTEEVERYYRDHLDDYRRPERVRLRQILVEDREAVDRALDELRAGQDFADVARRHSRDSSGDNGGVQGELAREDLPPMFAGVIFALEPGEVSQAVEAEYGFHVFQVLERLPAEVLPFDAVVGEIRRHLQEHATDEKLDRLVEEARDRYAVEVHIRNLPFDYRGSFHEESS